MKETISEYLNNNCADQLHTIAMIGLVKGYGQTWIGPDDLDNFFTDHKEEIDQLITNIFYDEYVHQPKEWFELGKQYGYDLVKIDEARRFFVVLSFQHVAQKIIHSKGQI